MFVTTPSVDTTHGGPGPDGPGAAVGHYDTYIAQSDSITGPYRRVAYLENFGPQAYFVT